MTTIISTSDYRSHIIVANTKQPEASATLFSEATATAIASEAAEQMEMAMASIKRLYTDADRPEPLTLVQLNGR